MATLPIQRNPSGAYVYEILVDGIVRYIGKGRGCRVFQQIAIARRMAAGRPLTAKVRRSRFYKLLAISFRDGCVASTNIVAEGLDDGEAFAIEVDMISKAPSGQLWNTAPGGEGQTSDFLRAAFRTAEMREFFSSHGKEQWAKNPERKYARFASPGSRQRQSDMVREKWKDPNYRAMQKEARAKRKKRKAWTPSEKRKQLALARWADPEFREKTIARMKESYRLRNGQRPTT